MKGRGLLVIVALLLVRVALADDTLPIRIDSNRNGVVYVQKVDGGSGFELLSEKTPTTYPARPGERIDVKVVAQDGLFHRWEGYRQNLAGPANVTIRLERQTAWERVAVAGVGLCLLTVGLLLVWRRKARVESEVTRSQIIHLERRVADAEKVGALAKTLGEYLVLDKLGAGAMGVVYKVRNAAGDIYAAKVPNQMDDRVLREAEVSASLKSPHIVECYGMIESDPNFLLMEYMDGQTVHAWLEKHHRVPLDVLDRLVRELLEAIQAAHAMGVYHRDIKPENMFLAREKGREVLKVMDFGLASSINAARLTRTGEAMGTPVYASPEQLSGNPTDATTDLYSVGVFIYELATGALPWNKTDPVALTLAKMKPLPKEPVELRPDLPEVWNRLVVDLLKSEPSERPRSVEAVRQRWSEGKI